VSKLVVRDAEDHLVGLAPELGDMLEYRAIVERSICSRGIGLAYTDLCRLPTLDS
jgi:hypothetical protein